MKYNIDNLHSYTDNELYNILLPLTEKIYIQYSYVNIEQSCYNQMIMDAIKKSRKTANDLKTISFDILFSDCLKNNINEYIRDLLPEQAETILLGYMSTNIKHPNKYIKVMEEFQKLIDFIDDIDLPSILDFFDILLIIKKNKYIERVMEQIVNANIDNLRKKWIDNVFENDILASLIEAYCIEHNIEIYDDKLPLNEPLQPDSEFSYEHDGDIDYDSTTIYLKEINKIPLLSSEEEKILFLKLKQGDSKVRKKLIDSNLRLVVSIAGHFSNSDLPFLDLIQEGNLGLMIAVDKFDITKDNKFSTYAYYWIINSIKRAIQNKEKTIRIPKYKLEQLNKYKNIKAKLTMSLSRKPSIEEIARQMGISVTQIEDLLQIRTTVVSMNSLIAEDSDIELGDLIPDTEENVEDMAIKNIEPNSLMNFINSSNLDLTERKVLELYFSLNGEKRKTLKKIGRILGFNAKSISEIKCKALRKLAVAIKKHMNESKDNCELSTMDGRKTTKDLKICELNRRKDIILKFVYGYFTKQSIEYTKEQIDKAFEIILNRDSTKRLFKDYLYNFETCSELDEGLKSKIKKGIILEISRYLFNDDKLELKTDVIDNQAMSNQHVKKYIKL